MVNVIEVHFKNSVELTPEKIDMYFSKYYIPTGILELRTIENNNKIYSFETMITYEFAIRAVCLLKDVLKEKVESLYFNDTIISFEFL
jgi:hypothetical protein